MHKIGVPDKGRSHVSLIRINGFVEDTRAIVKKYDSGFILISIVIRNG